jgi:large subunit ribosomal protein L30
MAKANAKNTSKKGLAVTLIRSLNKRKPNHLANAHGLGLKRIHQTVHLQDTPEIRGMINCIYYMVKVEEVI